MRITSVVDTKLGSSRSLRVSGACGLIALSTLNACGSNPPTSPWAAIPPASTDTNGGTPGASSSPPSMSSSGGSSTGISPNTTQDAGGSATQPSGPPVAHDAGAMMASDGGPGKSAPVVNAVCNPADKKPDPTRVPLNMIQGYAGFTTPPTTGPSKPVIETDPGLPGWTVYRADNLSGMLHPILIWAEGGCLNDGTLYGQYLLEAASYGFIALGDGIPTDPSADPGTNGSSAGSGGQSPMIMAMDWITAENERACSQYYHQLNVEKIAVSGQSCGGGMAIAAASDMRVTTAVINNSGLGGSFVSFHTPVAYFIGGSSDIAYNQAEADYMAINNVPIFNANDDVGHGATWGFVNGGEFGRVNVGWLQWQLMDDMTAAKMFVGADCELCKSSVWTVKKKMIP
jgi:hypothetical protein